MAKRREGQRALKDFVSEGFPGCFKRSLTSLSRSANRNAMSQIQESLNTHAYGGGGRGSKVNHEMKGY